MRRLAIVFVTLLVFAYPFAVYFGLSHFSPRYIALGLICIFLLRFILIAPVETPNLGVSRLSVSRLGVSTVRHIIFATIVGIIVGLIGIISNQILAVKLYPAAINLLMFSIFFYSLIHPPTVIARLAGISYGELSQDAMKYTTKVTIMWCVFFVINGAIALWTTFFSTMQIWTFYNGFLSYVLMGAIFVTEFTYRQWTKRKNRL